MRKWRPASTSIQPPPPATALAAAPATAAAAARARGHRRGSRQRRRRRRRRGLAAITGGSGDGSSLLTRSLSLMTAALLATVAAATALSPTAAVGAAALALAGEAVKMVACAKDGIEYARPQRGVGQVGGGRAVVRVAADRRRHREQPRRHVEALARRADCVLQGFSEGDDPVAVSGNQAHHQALLQRRGQQRSGEPELRLRCVQVPLLLRHHPAQHGCSRQGPLS